MMKKTNIISSTLVLLFTFSLLACNRTSTGHQTDINPTNSTDTVEQIVLTKEENRAYREQLPDKEFDKINNPESECHKTIVAFVKETNINEELKQDEFENLNITVHSISDNAVRLHIMGIKAEYWLALDFPSLMLFDITSNDIGENQYYYNAKLLHEMIACCFPDRIPTEEDFRSTIKKDNWTEEFYGGDYYSSSRYYEISTPLSLKEAYKRLTEENFSYGLLEELPTEDYETGDESETHISYKFSPQLYIRYTHPSAASDHYRFRTDENGTRISIEIENN